MLGAIYSGGRPGCQQDTLRPQRTGKDGEARIPCSLQAEMPNHWEWQLWRRHDRSRSCQGYWYLFFCGLIISPSRIDESSRPGKQHAATGRQAITGVIEVLSRLKLVFQRIWRNVGKGKAARFGLEAWNRVCLLKLIHVRDPPPHTHTYTHARTIYSGPNYIRAKWRCSEHKVDVWCRDHSANEAPACVRVCAYAFFSRFVFIAPSQTPLRLLPSEYHYGRNRYRQS